MPNYQVPVAQKALRRAHTELERRGHCKHELYDDDGRVCALGALDAGVDRAVISSDGDDLIELVVAYQAGRQHLMAWLKDQGIRADGFIPDWNDDPDTTEEDVLLGLKSAAEWEGSNAE